MVCWGIVLESQCSRSSVWAGWRTGLPLTVGMESWGGLAQEGQYNLAAGEAGGELNRTMVSSPTAASF